MDANLRRAAEQDMRRPAPDAHPSRLSVEEETADRSSAESGLHLEISISDHFESLGSNIPGDEASLPSIKRQGGNGTGPADRCFAEEMRRPAPDAPPSKRLRTGREGPEAKSFAELGRFDYRAAEQLTQGAQGFIVTCGFQRDKSATREAIAVLEEIVVGISQSATPAFSIVKLPCRGVILLIWKAAQKSDPSLPAPSTAVTRLVDNIHSKKRDFLKHVQRITPVDGMCLAQDAAIRELVGSLAKDIAGIIESCGDKQSHRVLQAEAASTERSPLFFAVAFKSRSGEQQQQQAAQTGYRLAGSQSDQQDVAQPKTAETPSHLSLSDSNQPTQKAASVGTNGSVPQNNGSSSLQQHAEATMTSNGNSDGCDVIPGVGQSRVAKSSLGQGSSASACISRGSAIAAAAESFTKACKDVGLKAEVNLKQPIAVISLEILPVGSCSLAAVSILQSKACVLKPKLTVKSLQTDK